MEAFAIGIAILEVKGLLEPKQLMELAPLRYQHLTSATLLEELEDTLLEELEATLLEELEATLPEELEAALLEELEAASVMDSDLTKAAS